MILEAVFLCLVVLYVIWLTTRKKQGLVMARKKRRKAGAISLSEILERYVGKNCAVYAFDDSFGVVGEILSLKDGWMEIKTKNSVKLFNVDYIKMIEDRPVKKK